jgi:hypothetical protein
MRAVMTILLLAAATASGVRSAHAQSPVVATAELVAAAPTGNGVRNLSFGTVTPLPGQNVQVNIPAAVNQINAMQYSGEFNFSIATLSGLDLRVTMPTQLRAGTLPPLTMNSNGNQYGGYCVTWIFTPCNLTNFNPASATPVRVCRTTRANGTCNPSNNWFWGTELSVYIGGMLTVPPTAAAGVYTGTVTLTIVQVY